MPPRRRSTDAAPQVLAPLPVGPQPSAPPGPILETDWTSTPLNPRDHRKAWTRYRVGGETFMTPAGPRWGWVPVHEPDPITVARSPA